MDNVNFEIDDLARRIGHLVLRIWQLEEQAKRTPLNGEVREVETKKSEESAKR